MDVVRESFIKNAFDDWILNMKVGMSPKTARELMEYDYEFFTEKERLLLSSRMLDELEKRLEV